MTTPAVLLDAVPTEALLRTCYPGCKAPAAFVPLIAAAWKRYEQTNPLRQAMWLAQTGHESGDLTKFGEDLYYTTPARLRAIWPSKFVTGGYRAEDYLRNPRKLGDLVYASLGGYDGLGEGAIQLTGLAAKRKFAAERGMTLDRVRAYLMTPAGAVMGAAWYFKEYGCNAAADARNFERVVLITAGKTAMTPDLAKRINYANRVARWNRALHALGA